MRNACIRAGVFVATVLLLCAIAFVGTRAADANRTCNYAEASHHVTGTFDFGRCFRWNFVNAEDNDR